jgi:hypothetical protein
MKKYAAYAVLVIAAILAFVWWRKGSASTKVDGVVPGDGSTWGGGTGGDGSTGNDTIAPNAPRTVMFEDFAAMRFIGNDGKKFAGEHISRKIGDPLYNATGFLVKEGVDLSRFKIGEPVRVRAAANNTDPHFDTGFMDVRAFITAIPGHSSSIRGTWVVTNAGWRTGSSGKERGTLEAL